MRFRRLGWVGEIVLLLMVQVEAAASGIPAWRPIKDGVYLQEVGEKVKTDIPVTSVALLGDQLYAVMDGRVLSLTDGALRKVDNAPAHVALLKSLGGALWASAKEGVFRFDGGEWVRVHDAPFVDLCLHNATVYGATRDAVFRMEDSRFVDIIPEGGYLSTDSTLIMEDGSQVLADPVSISPIERIASYGGTLYLLQPGHVALIDGKTFFENPVDWGQMPSPKVRSMLSLGNRLYIATDRGLAVLRGMALTALRGTDGLPYEDTTCLAAGFEGDLWIGTTRGAIRQAGNGFHYFAADRWLPGDNVHDIAVGDRVVYVATDSGVGIIRYEPYTLLKKAAYYEQYMNAWGQKRLGFIHQLYWSGEQDGWLREISDNDGGHTAHYLAAMSFKYAATGDEQARQEALDAFKAMAWLDDITPKPGFIARAIWSVKGDKGEMANRGSGGLPAKWYPTEDGLWYWKGDTSSDEVDGHFYAVSIFHDLAAQGSEKERAKRHLANIASHIIDNGYVLRDMDGKPTRWGRWDPEYLLRPYGYESRGLNGMEAQSFMQSAFALTGDEKYKQAFDQLIKWGYHTYTVRQRATFPPDTVVPWDDELAFRAFFPLIRYTTDPYFRSIYLRSLDRSWEIMRMQHLPFYNFMYGGLTGNDCEEDRAVQHLREWPLDMVNYTFRNSYRCDVGIEPGYTPYQGGTRVFSPREAPGGNLRHDGGNGGRTVTVPAFWLEGYWMGRYFGLITAPDPADSEAIGPPPTQTQCGAKPYDGTPRPEM